MPNHNRLAQKSNFHKKILASIAVLFITAVVTVGSFVLAEILNPDESIEIEKDTELTYYLHVKYDGVDVTGVESNDDTKAEVLSDRIKVTDVIPKGLTFKGFVTSSNGTFGSVLRNNSSIACAGRVYDDTPDEQTDTGIWDAGNLNYHYHGLHYNETTREVSFYVERLQAGCQLTIGIITQTPSKVDDDETPDIVETRRDFYNTAFAQESLINARSNTVHVFMGDPSTPKYHVYYRYDTNNGEPPAGASDLLPTDAEYTKGAPVAVEPNLELENYDFFGWESANVTPTNGVFTMPSSDVYFYGYFAPKATVPTYNVIYEIRSTDPVNDPLPEWATSATPRTRSYEAGEEVAVDSTEAGTFDGYVFSGWLKSADGTASNNQAEMSKAGVGFVMPAHDVYIYGYYSRKTYKVTYQFEGSVIPDNADSLLPAEETHYAGEIVTTAPNPTADGYRFLGWYKSDTFRMPEEDVVIYGEWGIQAGEFEPIIEKAIVDPQTAYQAEDVINFKVTLCNTATYDIHDVIIQEQLEGAKFTTDGASFIRRDEGVVTSTPISVTLPADSIIRIDSIPGSHCAVVYSSYQENNVNERDVTNTVEMIGALADNDFNLNTSHPYIASVTFHVAETVDPGVPTGVEHKNLFIFIGLVIIAVAGGGVVILNRRKS